MGPSARHVSEMDVAVFGGGPAGCASALRLLDLGYSVTIVTHPSALAVRVGETFAPAIRMPLGKLRLWSRFLESNPVPSFEIQSVWGTTQMRVRNSIFDPYGPGWHVVRRKFDNELLRTTEERGCEFIFSSQFPDVAWDGQAWNLRIASGPRIRAHFLVDATGRASALGCRLGGRRIQYDHLIALVAFSDSPGFPQLDNATLVEASRDGWWYSALLPNRKFILTYLTDYDLLPLGATFSRTHFASQLRLTKATQERLASDWLPDEIHGFSANSSRLEYLKNSAWLPVGDAFTAHDPLCGQGVLWALEGGITAANSIDQFLNGNKRQAEEYQTKGLTSFESYLTHLNSYYSIEQRWPQSPFWARRRTRFTKPYEIDQPRQLVKDVARN